MRISSRPFVLGATAALCAAVPVLTAAPAVAGSVQSHTCTGTLNGQSIRLTVAATFTSANSDDLTSVTARATDLDGSGSYRNPRVDATSLRISVYTAAQRNTVNTYSTRSPFTVHTDPTTRTSGKDARSVTARALYTSGGASARLSCSVFTF